MDISFAASAVLQTAAVVLQIAAAFFALRLILVSRGRFSWILICSAFCVMAVRRSLSLWQLANGSHPPDLSDEGAAVIISALMLAGVLAIPSLFHSIQQASETLRRAKDAALRESEERFRTIFENAGIGMSLTDQEGRIIDHNPAMQKMMGRGARELVGKTFMEITHPDDLERNLKLFHDLVAGKLEQFQMEKRYRRPDGQYFWGGVTVSAVKGAGGAHLYNIAMIEDITLRKQMQDELQESEQKLRYLASQLLTAQERERERISRELHDELGQSLLVMKLQAKTMEKALAKGETVQQQCREMGDHLDRLVDEVRRLARDLSPAMVNDLGLSSALKRLVKEFARHYGIKAHFEMVEGLDEFFSREPQVGIYRVLQESLTNIGKYAQASQLRIAIKRENDKVSFMVADNGKGFNVDEVMGPDPSRRGMGLMAMVERARMMGGTLKIRSQEGDGTRLVLNIPLSDSQAGKEVH